MEKLAQIGKALETVRKEDGKYPDRSIGRGLSWRVPLLVHLGQTKLYLKFRLHEPWDSPDNKRLLAEIPDVYRSSERRDGKTNFVLVTGPETIYPGPQGLELCADGFEATLLAVAVSDERAVPWTAPDDYVLRRETLQPDLFGAFRDCCYALFGGATGVRRLPANIADEALLALFTPAGGEPIQVPAVTAEPTLAVDEKLIAALSAQPLVRFAPPAAEKPPGTEKPAPDRVDTAPERVAEAAPREPPDRPAPPVERSAAVPPGVPDGRQPVPEDALLQRVAGMYREIYGEKLKTATTLEDKRKLARQIFEQSGSLAADPVGQYVLLRAARDAAAQAGDIDTALHAILELAATFRVEPLPMQLKALEQAVAAAQKASEWQSLFQHALRLGDQALAKDDFAGAQRMYTVAQTIARRENREEDLARVYEKVEAWQQTRLAHGRISKHAYTLVSSPDEPTANAALGRYLCLVKNDWDRGLLRLLQGNDEPLRRLAQLERRPPATEAQQVELGDAWWDWAEAAGNRLEGLNARQRAAHWYRQAVPAMSSTLWKSRVEKRIADAEQAQMRKKPALAKATRAVVD